MCKIKTIEFRREEFQLPSNLNTEILEQAIPCVDQRIISDRQAQNIEIIESLGHMLEAKGINPNAMTYNQFIDAITKDTSMREKVFESLLLNGDDFTDLETIEVLFK